MSGDAERVPCRVRPAEEADLEAMIGLLRQLFALEVDFGADPECQRRGLRSLLARPGQARVLVAEGAGAVRGMCSVQSVVSTAEGGLVGWLEDLVVAEGWRGRGLGRCLLRAACAWARQQGLSRLQLVADRSNAPARDFYWRQGWDSTQLVVLRRRL
ncbi:GNAT family N-acetyltransferase [Thiohalorhabdus sp. Cl-TMA]|uniref:N-acetyltransferase family protein n=1 Tax=Thiohalorhabdus methylotrophus TaxID=3242694 RepID=A0ABV4TQL5_9GAMM